MKRYLFIILLIAIGGGSVCAQSYDGFGDDGFMQQENTFNPSHKADSTKSKKVAPRGMYVWTIDRMFGDRTMQLRDTLQHLFMNTGQTAGRYGEYNTTGNLGAPRINRIFMERNHDNDFMFLKPYDYFLTQPDELRFTNTLSPITNLNYYSCGDKTDGEDYFKALFAVNVNKQLGVGFKFNYMYGRGFYQNQSTSLFDFTFWTSYIGDRYQAHAIISTDHMKNTENGGIADDNYITHPESFDDNYMALEIPVNLSQNWSRNDALHFFLTHRYSVGFNRKVPMTKEEIEARKFALASQKDAEERKSKDSDGEDSKGGNTNVKKFAGRPKDAKVMGDLPTESAGNMSADRIAVDSKEKEDSLLAAEQKTVADSTWYKNEYVPVTSFIHTLSIDKHDRNYIAYQSPKDHYSKLFPIKDGVMNDSIDDDMKHFRIRNVFAISMLEGFSKWVKTGFKAFISHEYRRFTLPDTVNRTTSYDENIIRIGGQLSKTMGTYFHYNVTGDFGVAGDHFGEVRLDGKADVSIPLFGDTTRVYLDGFFHVTDPDFYMTHYHSKHIWWDEDGMSKVTHFHVGGALTFPKTKTSIKAGIDNISQYNYLGMSYTRSSAGLPVGLEVNTRQSAEDIRLFTLQLSQDFRLGILNWENRVTYQNSSAKSVLPVPDFNVWTNLYLDFKIAKVLHCHFGADATYFSSYYAPEYCPQMGMFAVQEEGSVKTKVGDYPFVNVYANFVLKGCRFFVRMGHVNQGQGSRNYFTTPHHPMNERMLQMGISWNFYN